MNRNFDPYDHHDYGLIRVSPTQYVRCTAKCCKPRWLTVSAEGEWE